MAERLVISALGHRGDGVAETPGGPVFVPYALPGEAVLVEDLPGGRDRRRLIAFETASADRRQPVCPHFGVCGGCAVQHLAADSYRRWKRDLVATALSQQRLEAALDDLVDGHGEGRRRAVLHARRGRTGVLQVGFSAPRAHVIVPIDRCPILAPALGNVIAMAWKLVEALGSLRGPIDLQVTASDAGLDVDIRGCGPLPPARLTRLAEIAAAQRLARLTRHGDLVVQAALPTLRIGRADVALPPGGFLQATAAGEAALAALVCDHAAGARRIADLFCGIGPFALRLAERVPVTAIDADAASIAALARAAAATPGLRPVTATGRDLFRRPLAAPELAAFDAVVFDPPRQGAEAQAAEIARSKVATVIAVSCNPATFARDARLLVDAGFRIERITPVDQFR